MYSFHHFHNFTIYLYILKKYDTIDLSKERMMVMKRWWKASALALLLLTAPTSAQAKTYKDVQPTDWYYKQVHTLSDKGILDGFQDDTFRPSDKVTRAQVTKILNATIRSERLNHTKQREKIPFIDVRSDRWFAPHVATMYEYGIASGLPDRSFRPDRLIKRSEMARMLAETFHMDRATGTAKTFSDVHPSKWYAPYVAQLSKANVTQGSTRGEFLPDAPVTRGELSIFLARAIEWNDSLQRPNELPAERPSQPERPATPPVEQPSKPVEKPTKPETKPERPIEKPKEDEVKKPEQKPEQPSKPTEPEKVVLKEVTIPFYDTYAKRDSLAINGAVIKLYKSKEDFERGKKPVFEQKPQGSIAEKEESQGFTLNEVEVGTYYLVSENKGLAIAGQYSYYYKDYEGTVTIHKDGKVDGRVELERIRNIPHSSDPDFLAPEKVKDSKEYFIKRINAYRKENGLKPLDFESNPDIPKIADGRAKHLTEYYGHQLPDGSTINGYFMTFNPKYQTRIREAIVRSSVDVESAFKDWKNSPEHNGIMLSSEVNTWGDIFENYAGIGVNRNKNGSATYSLNIYRKLIR